MVNESPKHLSKMFAGILQVHISMAATQLALAVLLVALPLEMDYQWRVFIALGMAACGVVSAVRAMLCWHKAHHPERLIGLSDEDILCEALSDIGGVGAKLGARNMPSEEATSQIQLPALRDDVTTMVEKFFQENGYKISTEVLPAKTQIKGVIGAGQKHMNPAVLTVNVEDSGDKVKATLHGVAKEGFIKQNAGKEAVERAKAALTEGRNYSSLER